MTNLDHLEGQTVQILKGLASRVEAAEVTATELNWQPIETAPKDASTVLVMKMHLGKILWAMSAYWDDNEPCPCRPPKCRPGTHRSWRSGLDRIADPTHWMPLPEPPVSGYVTPSEKESNSTPHPAPRKRAKRRTP